MSLPSANTRGDESFAVSASTELLQSGLADHSYDQFLHTLFNSLLTRVGDHTPIRVNEIARANHINVYIINLANYDQNLRKKLRPSLIRILVRLKNNALSYPPNFMIFDQDYVASITENAFFDQLHLRLALDAGKHRQVELGASDVDPDILATYGLLDDILRFRELRQYRYPGGDEELRKTGARIAYNVMREQVIVPYMDFAFSPIFFHEQGHLVTLSEGGFFEFLDELAASFANRRVASAEAIADKFAVAQLSKAIGQAAKDTRIEEVSAVVSTLKLLRDQVLIDAFSGFRGLEPENFLYYLVHKDCRAEEFKETKALEFFDPRKIHAVYRTFFPLLLPQEFAAIRRGLLMNARFGTHQNHAIRVDQFLAIVSEGSGWDMNNLNVASKLLQASVEGSPADLAPEVPINGMKLSYDELFDGLQGLNVGQPINCPDRTCSVAKFADGTPGFIESVGRENLRLVRVILPLFGPGRTGRLDDVDTEYARNILVFLQIIENALRGDPMMGGKGIGKLLLEEMADQMSACGAASGVLDLPNLRATIYTINPQGWIGIELAPREGGLQVPQ